MVTFGRSSSFCGIRLRRCHHQRLPSRANCRLRDRLVKHICKTTVGDFDTTRHHHHRGLVPLRHQRVDVLGGRVAVRRLQCHRLHSGVDWLSDVLGAELLDQHGLGQRVFEEIISGIELFSLFTHNCDRL
jgi:hypothetical protein